MTRHAKTERIVQEALAKVEAKEKRERKRLVTALQGVRRA